MYIKNYFNLSINEYVTDYFYGGDNNTFNTYTFSNYTFYDYPVPVYVYNNYWNRYTHLFANNSFQKNRANSCMDRNEENITDIEINYHITTYRSINHGWWYENTDFKYENRTTNRSIWGVLYIDHYLDIFVNENLRTPSRIYSNPLNAFNRSEFNYTCHGRNVRVNFDYDNRYRHVNQSYMNLLPRNNSTEGNFTTVVTNQIQDIYENYYQEYFNFSRIVPCNLNGKPYCISIFRNNSYSNYSDIHYYYKNDSSPDIELLNITHTNLYKTYVKAYYNKYYNRTVPYYFNVTYHNDTITYNQTFYIDDIPANQTNFTNFTSTPY